MKFESKHKSDQNVICYIALGSNMGDSYAYLQKALQDLTEQPNIHDVKVSRFYQSKPHGPKDQPDYLNAAAVFETNLLPEALLDVLQKIENENDRVREGVVRWGARTLDLDLLFYANETINTKRLTVPHPRICERSFVLLPLRDLLGTKSIPNLKINQSTTILDSIDALSNEELNNIKEFSHVK